MSNNAPPAAPLFRSQVLQQLGNKQFGTILLASSVSSWVLTALFLTIVAAIVAFFCLFGTTRKALCQGVLLPTGGIVRVVPGQNGVLKEVRVREGQTVNPGDVLFILSGERSSSLVPATQKTVSTLLQGRRDSVASELGQSSRQSHQRVTSARRRADQLRSEMSQLSDQISLQATRVQLAEAAYKRFAELQKTNFISQSQLQDKQAELIDQRQRLADVLHTKATAQREIVSTLAELQDLQIQGTRDVAALERSMSAIEQELAESEARREIVVRAPQAGMISAVTAVVGQTVASNTVLSALLPSGAELEAEIYAPSRSIGFIEPGMTVLLRYQAYPYQKFGQHRAT